MDDSESDYYLAREQQELALAEISTNPAVAGIHRDLAARYAALVRRRGTITEYFDTGNIQSEDFSTRETVTTGRPRR